MKNTLYIFIDEWRNLDFSERGTKHCTLTTLLKSDHLLFMNLFLIQSSICGNNEKPKLFTCHGS